MKREPTKAELQRRMQDTRDSITETVDDLKETVEDQVQSVKQTVTGVVEWREQFLREPLVWSLGALALGLVVGYAAGQSRAARKPQGGRRSRSQIVTFADALLDELSVVGSTVVLPALDRRVRELLGLELTDALEQLGRTSTDGVEKRATRARRPRSSLTNATSKARRTRKTPGGATNRATTGQTASRKNAAR